MDLLLYAIIIIATSVVLSVFINLLVMRKTAEIATKEIEKIEKRIMNRINTIEK